jgi:hypothetical protein
MKYCILSNCLNIINTKEMNDAKYKISKWETYVINFIS